MASPQQADGYSNKHSDSTRVGKVSAPRFAANDPNIPKNRIKGSDRSYLNQPAQVRNVRSSSVPGAPKNKSVRTRETTDEAFSESYAKQGLQPSSVDNQEKNTPTEITNQQQIVRNTAVGYSSAPNVPGSTPRQRRFKLKKKKVSSTKKNLARARATAINIGLGAWNFPLWLAFTTPVATLYSIFFGLGFGVDSLLSTNTEGEGFLVAITNVFKTVVSSIVDAVSLALSVVGIDGAVFHPGTMALILGLVLLGYYTMFTLIAYLQYKIVFLEPLSGENEGFKKLTCILPFFFYLVPILNLLPWFMLWPTVIWFNPK